MRKLLYPIVHGGRRRFGWSSTSRACSTGSAFGHCGADGQTPECVLAFCCGMDGAAERLKTSPSTGKPPPGHRGPAGDRGHIDRRRARLELVDARRRGALERALVANAISTLSAGLTLFFTLSGFLLYRPFAAAIARGTPRQSFPAYLQNRFLRIAPAYWVILLVTALVLGAASVRTASGALEVGRLTDPLDFISSALLLQDYRPETMIIGIGPAWSLAVEVVFYLALPLLS